MKRFKAKKGSIPLRISIIILALLLLVGFQNCGHQGSSTVSDSTSSSQAGAPTTGTPTTGVTPLPAPLPTPAPSADPAAQILAMTVPHSCLFNGEYIAIGSIVTGYSIAGDTDTQICRSNGFLESTTGQRVVSPSTGAVIITYPNSEYFDWHQLPSFMANANVAPCYFDGKKIPDGQSVTAYANAIGPQCLTETRTCHNGLLFGTYPFAACAVTEDPFKAACALGASGSFYAFAAPASKNTGGCHGQIRTCAKNVINGSYPYTTCVTCADNGSSGDGTPLSTISDAQTVCALIYVGNDAAVAFQGFKGFFNLLGPPISFLTTDPTP